MSSIDESSIPLSQRAMAAPRAAYLDTLNPQQRAAVETLEGPVLMLAGAGTGKTKALTARIAHLLHTQTAMPNEILAVTFTNKAAREMKIRVGTLLGHPAEGMPWMGTFHSICVKLLRRHAELAGLKSNFTILDTDDQIRLLKQLIVADGIDEKRWPARLLSGVIDNWKNRAWTPENVPASEASAFNGRGVELYAAYQKRLLELNAVDFGDLLLHVVTIFQTHADLLAQYQRWFRYILVDEYQDTNVAQYLWLRLLAGTRHNICCVGDDDQSIYGWRGAEVGNILRFEKDFPGATVIRLEQNYRSTPHILAAASGVIAGNSDRLGKTLWTEAEEGEKLRLIGHWDGEEEARWIGEEIEAMQIGTRGMAPRSLDHIAILVRASHQMRAFEDRFLSIGLPYRVIGGPRFYERLEIRDAMAYFRVVTSPSDDLAFERIVNTPRRGVGDKALQSIRMVARDKKLSFYEATRLMLAMGEIKGKARGQLTALIDGFDRWHQEAMRHRPMLDSFSAATGPQPPVQPKASGADDPLSAWRDIGYDDHEVVDASDDVVGTSDDAADAGGPASTLAPDAVPSMTHVELAEIILDESGYTAMWQNDKSPEAPGRLENLKELVKALEEFENLQGFLEHVALIMDNEQGGDQEKVTLMTLHGAKGLEFPAVFLPGWEDGLFPSQRSMDESGAKGLEEERRLAYVGITRAEEICTISFASNRRVYGQWQSQLPSRFIDELPPEHVDVQTPPGLHGGGFGAAGMTSTVEDRAARADVYSSPGWKRLQSRNQSSAPRAGGYVIDGSATPVFKAGARVFHKKFGYGTVVGVEADKLDVEFDKAGAKKLMAKFVVEAERADDVPF